jgi:hypothetical protein
MDHFKRLLEQACLNNAYPVRHKLKDCGMMRTFMTLGSLTWGTELDEDPGRSDMMLFPGENAVMMVYGGLTRIGTRGTTPHRLRRPKEGSAITQSTIQKISEDHDMLSKA